MTQDSAPEHQQAGGTMTTEAIDMRGISRCWQNNGWHYAGAGPCFDTYEQVSKYRIEYDAAMEAQKRYQANRPFGGHTYCWEMQMFQDKWRS